MKKNINLLCLTTLLSVTNIGLLKSMDPSFFGTQINTQPIQNSQIPRTRNTGIVYGHLYDTPEYNDERSYTSGKYEENRIASLQSPDTYKQMCPLEQLLYAIKYADIITTEQLLRFHSHLPIHKIKNVDGMTPMNFFAFCLQDKKLYNTITQKRNALSIGAALIHNTDTIICYLMPDKEKKHAIARLGTTYELYKNTRHAARAIIAHELLSRINQQIIDLNAAIKRAPRVYTVRPRVDQKG